MKLRSGKEIIFVKKENKPGKPKTKMTESKDDNKGPSTSKGTGSSGAGNHGDEDGSNFDFKTFNAMIPMFRGNKAELRKFIDSGDLLFDALTEDGQTEFERLIMLKLDSYIYNWCQNKGVNSWEGLKENLKRKYKTTSNLPLLQKELFACRQNKRESVGEFGERIEKKLFDMNEVARGEIEEFDVGRYKQYHEKLALRAFQDGLKDTLRIYIKARNYETLSEAITEAMNEEAYTTDSGSEQRGERNMICYRCGRQGHSRNQCFARINEPNRSGEYRNNAHDRNPNNSFTQGNRPGRYGNNSNEWNRQPNLTEGNNRDRNYQEPRNFTPRNFETGYRNNNAQENQNGEYRNRNNIRPEQRNVHFTERNPKNGERQVGRQGRPTA